MGKIKSNESNWDSRYEPFTPQTLIFEWNLTVISNIKNIKNAIVLEQYIFSGHTGTYIAKKWEYKFNCWYFLIYKSGYL